MSASDVFFDEGESYTKYEAVLLVRDKLIGGVPKNPDTIAAWLRARLELGDRDLIELARRTELEMRAVDVQLDGDDFIATVARQFEAGNGFKMANGVLIYEGRCAKAALKEAANVAFPGTSWPGKPAHIRKGLMRFLAERVFCEDVSLGVSEPTGTEQRIKHIIGPQGPRSAINVVDFIEQPKLRLQIKVLDDCIGNAVWARIWSCAEEIGIGADRARSDGRFDLLEWNRVE